MKIATDRRPVTFITRSLLMIFRPPGAVLGPCTAAPHTRAEAARAGGGLNKMALSSLRARRDGVLPGIPSAPAPPRAAFESVRRDVHRMRQSIQSQQRSRNLHTDLVGSLPAGAAQHSVTASCVSGTTGNDSLPCGGSRHGWSARPRTEALRESSCPARNARPEKKRDRFCRERWPDIRGSRATRSMRCSYSYR